MKSWLILTGGLIVWAIHFFGLYGIGEFLAAAAPGTPVLVAAAVLTLACIAANGWLIFYCRRLRETDAFSAWRRSIGTGAAAFSMAGVIWQALALPMY